MLSVDQINADSNYIIIRNMIKRMSDKHAFTLVLNSNKEYIKDGLDKDCRIIYIKQPTSKRNQVIWFEPELMRNICNEFGIQLIFNNVVEQGHNLKQMYAPMDRAYEMKVINYHHYNIHPSFGENTYQTMQNILLHQLIGSQLVDVNYFHSEHSYNMFVDEYSKLFKNTLTNTHVELGKHGKESVNVDKYDKYTFIYNHRLAGYKNFQDTIDMFNKLHKKHDFQVIFTTADTSNTAKIAKLPYAKIVRATHHDEYIKELSKCHANVTNSAHETYCISIVESMMNNQVIVAPNAVTFPELLGRDYKYLFNNEEEQYRMLDEILTNDIRTMQHQDLHESKQIDIYDKLIERVQYEKRPLQGTKHKETIEKTFSKIKAVTPKEAAQIIYKTTGVSNQSFPMTKITLLLEDMNYTYNRRTNKYEK